MPVDDGAARLRGRPICPEVGQVAAVEDPELVLVVADAELDVFLALEVGFDPQQVAVPAFRGLQIAGLVGNGGKPAQRSV
jgi:hypothetical protein